jgi:benzoate/toluate 1,2-dioxygenase alpha subunit
MNPLLSSERSEDEGLFVRQHEFWAKIMLDGMAKDASAAPMMEAAE